MELATLAARLYAEAIGPHAVSGTTPHGDDDPRFRNEAWTAWPFSQIRAGFRNAETFWREATVVPGVTAHHTSMMQFFARQWLGMMTPANWLPTNPVVLRDVAESRGTHLLQGMDHWLHDATGVPSAADIARSQRFVVGRDVAVTPGKVVYRNRLIELIRYDAQTATVYAEPVLIIPSWIMKFYILDLSPHNSMVRYLVEQGHTVYMVSWRNPDAGDRDLSMDDYLQLGVFDAMSAISEIDAGCDAVHAVGYCLGGTLLAIAAAAMARSDDAPALGSLPELKSMTLLAAQTDFSQPGELGLFIDESQIAFLDNIARGKGFLTGKQMAGSFQFLHSRELFWTRRMHEYLMGEREQATDLMAWNADTTRLPARMHHQYLTSLYLRNALANSAYRVNGRAVSLADVQTPMFVVGTERDHISPWRSVYKLHHLCDAEITFVLTSGGHNAGIVSEPGHANRSYRSSVRAAHAPWMSDIDWEANARSTQGSWWPEWHRWLAERSGQRRPAKSIAPVAALAAAPGEYVMQRYRD